MAESTDDEKRDAVLRKMLNTPPKQHKTDSKKPQPAPVKKKPVGSQGDVKSN